MFWPEQGLMCAICEKSLYGSVIIEQDGHMFKLPTSK